MGIVCFTSLKGGVGKTSLSSNVAHALTQRGSETLLIDLDPTGHATRFFKNPEIREQVSIESPLARLLIGSELNENDLKNKSLIEHSIAEKIPLLTSVRPNLALIPSGPELRHFLWGRGARGFKMFFPKLIKELHTSYDYIIIDTPPDFNVLTRNAIAVSDLSVVPVDSSAMSIHCMEEVINSSTHIKGPVWAIVRTMVAKQATTMHKLTGDRLHKNLAVCDPAAIDSMDLDSDDEYSEGESILDFITNHHQSSKNEKVEVRKPVVQDASPIYLLNSIVYRTEQQNKLSFLGKTAFDFKAASPLKQQYSSVTKELEYLLSFAHDHQEAFASGHPSYGMQEAV